MPKDIKENPYSIALGEALQAVADIGHPDYIRIPIFPSTYMCKVGAEKANITVDQARTAYQSMIEAWAHAPEIEP